VVTYVFSGLALVTSLASLCVSVLTYRMSGPKVAIDSHSFKLKMVNAGKGDIDIDGATCDLLGPTVTALPHRMKSASSHHVEFHGPAHRTLGRAGLVTVNVGLGNGRTLTSQVRMTGVEQAELRRYLSNVRGPAPHSLPPTRWSPPSQEEL
jgi:hypothetical protein